MPPTEAQAAVLTDLARAMDERDPTALSRALSRAHRGGLFAELAEPFIALAEALWHAAHEDIVQSIQRLRPPAAVPALERAAVATHAYRHYDELFGLARKCTWALADIGTADAYAALERLARQDEALIRRYARRRLEGWRDEMPRKPAGSYEAPDR